MSKQRYTFWFNVEEAWKASFLADSLEDAEEMLEELQADDYESFEAFFGDGYWDKNKGIDVSIDTNSLEYVGDEE